MTSISVYAAIQTMRDLSARRVPFSFTFMSWSESKQSTHGIVEVRQGRLLPKSREKSQQAHDDDIEPYVDLDTMEYKRFYQPLLMTFNGQKLQLTDSGNEQ